MEKIWDITTVPKYYENEIESFVYKEHKEDGVIVNQSDSALYSFTIKDVNDNILFSSGYVCADVKITKPNNASIGEENVTLVNTGNLFSRATLYIGSIAVEEIQKPSLVHHINGLINFTNDYSTSEATNMLYFKDTSDYADRNFLKFEGAQAADEKMDTLIKKIKLNEKYNKGFDERYNLTKNSSVVKVWIPIKHLFGFFNDYRKIMSSIDVKFEFMRNEFNNNMLFTDAANPNYEVKISNISMWLPHVKLNPEAQANYLKLSLNPSANININWCAPRLRESNTVTGNSGTIHVKSSTDELVSIFVVPQYVERENSQSKNNMVFDNLDLTRCWIRINNEMYPIQDYSASFKEGELNYSRYYSDFLAAGLNTINSESGCLVSFDEYRKLYPIIHFDVSNHPSFINVSNLNVEFTWYLRSDPGKAYKFYFILVEKRSGNMNMYNRKFETLPTLQ